MSMGAHPVEFHVAGAASISHRLSSIGEDASFEQSSPSSEMITNDDRTLLIEIINISSTRVFIRI